MLSTVRFVAGQQQCFHARNVLYYCNDNSRSKCFRCTTEFHFRSLNYGHVQQAPEPRPYSGLPVSAPSFPSSTAHIASWVLVSYLTAVPSWLAFEKIFHVLRASKELNVTQRILLLTLSVTEIISVAASCLPFATHIYPHLPPSLKAVNLWKASKET